MIYNMKLYKRIKRRILWEFEHITNIIYRRKFNIGENTVLRGGIKCTNPKQVTIGNNSFINYGVFFYVADEKSEEAKITIGNNVFIAPKVLITTATHNIESSFQRVSKQTIHMPVKIDDGCWIGANVTILPGVHIGKGCVIGAGAVVNKDCEPNGVYVGVPAKRIKDLQS